MLNFEYKVISAGKYVEGTIDALSQEEASFKLKDQKIIITKLIRTKKKAAEKPKKKGGFFSKLKGLSFFKILIFFCNMIFPPSNFEFT